MNFNSDNNFLMLKIYLKRNLSNYNFTPSMPKNKAREIYQKVVKACSFLPDIIGSDFQFSFYELETMSILERKKYEAMGYFSETVQSQPGLGIAICGKCFILINFDDHINICSMCKNILELEPTLTMLYKVETALGEMLPFAFDKQLGFVTSNFDYIGLGLKVDAFLYSYFNILDSNTKSQFFKEIKNATSSFFSFAPVQTINYQNFFSDFIFLLSTTHSSTGTIQEFFKKFFSVVETMNTVHNEKITSLYNTRYDEIYDFILRAFLIAKNAILISEHHLFDLIATLSLGSSLKVLENISFEELSKLFFDLRTAFIVETFLNETKMSLEDITVKMIDKKRAKLLRNAFEKVTIKDYIE